MDQTGRAGGRLVQRPRWRSVWGVLLAALASSATASNYDFSYRLSGDRRVAPVQVFDDGQQTWLQFAPGQVMPAVFLRRSGAAAQLASYQQQGPYLVLQGTADQIDLRIGDILARADYTGKAARQAVTPAATGSARASAAAPAAGGVSLAEAETYAALPLPGNTAAVSGVGVPASSPVSALSGGGVIRTVGVAGPGAAVSSPVTGHTPAAAALEFDAALSDRNMRRVLERWARQAGWVFQAEHWTVDVDIPLVGAAAFGADFRNAVRGLLAATELGERPLQPCFYANRVLRVVALSQACDRTVSPLAVAARP